MPIALNDGNIDFGSFTTVINGVTYTVESANPTKETNRVEVPDTVGTPQAQVITVGVATGTITVQLPNTGSSILKAGDLFVMPARYNASGSAFSASITNVSTPVSYNDYRKMECGYVQKIN